MKELLIFLANLITVFSHLTYEDNNINYTVFEINDQIDFESHCIKKICIMKCCPPGYYFLDAECTLYNDSNSGFNFSEFTVYDKNVEDTGKNLLDVFNLAIGSYFNFSRQDAYDLSMLFKNYLTEDGVLLMELPNAYKRWTKLDNNRFCLDYQLPNINDTFETPEAKIFTWMEDDIVYDVEIIYVASALLISCFFLLLVLFVYCIIPELRNLCGQILMAYVASLLGAFIMLSTLQFITMAEKHTPKICLRFTYAIYYFFLSSFCWMNVMSFDIWWTFRGYAKARPIHRRGEPFKFGMYCLYAWGLPVAMTLMLKYLNDADLSHIPWFIQPRIIGSGCFIEGGEKFVYLYCPMLILIMCNWILFLMTAYNVYRLRRGTAVLDSPAAGNPTAHRKHQHRFMVYLKLSVIMGVSWVLEVVSFLFPQFRVWYLSDAYNLLIGVSIFLIFVCKIKIFKKVSKRIRMSRPQWSPYSKSRSSSYSSDSDNSQETTLQICASPTGNGIYKR